MPAVRERGYAEGYIAGQWHATEQLMKQINSLYGPFRPKDFYRMLMEYRPDPPQK